MSETCHNCTKEIDGTPTLAVDAEIAWDFKDADIITPMEAQGYDEMVVTFCEECAIECGPVPDVSINIT